MADNDSSPSRKPEQVKAPPPTLHFDVSTGLKRVLGRELITNAEVAVFEMVKNSFDAGADQVHLYFDQGRIVIADNGKGMSFEDLKEKWLFVAYSEKRQLDSDKGFRDIVAERSNYAGSKGIGRFSSDRIGERLILQSRAKTEKSSSVNRIDINWGRFDRDQKQHFETVPVEYTEVDAFELPKPLTTFGARLDHGTVIELTKLRQKWDRAALLSLKSSLAKLINPFGSTVDKFSIHIHAPDEDQGDRKVKADAAKKNEKPLVKDLVNGRVGNFIFEALRERTTFIVVTIDDDDDDLKTTLTDRGEVVYRIREPNPYKNLAKSGFRCEIYYLNQSAKLTFARRVGLPSVQFGSVFLFRNGFRVFPIGDDGDDWFAFDRRKQQGYARYLGTREIIGRVDIFGSEEDFQEASSRNQGLIDTPAVRQLKSAVMDHCLKRLEKYVVPVSWRDEADGDSEDLSRLLTDSGRARVSAAVAKLVDNDRIELLEYSKQLVGLLSERSSEFESSLASLRLIAEKTGDNALTSRLDKAEKRFEELQKSEAEALRVAERERAAAERERATAERERATAAAASARADVAEAAAEHERRRAYFLESAVNLDAATILNLHHQVTIYSVDIGQQIENLISASEGQKEISRDTVLRALEQIALLNRKVLAIARFAAKAKFKLDSERIETDLAAFVAEYIDSIAKTSGSARTKVSVQNKHPGIRMRFNPIDVSIVVDNLISNARRAKASMVRFELSLLDKGGLLVRVIDNGRGLAAGIDRERIFEMGYTTTRGSGLGLYHVRQVLRELGGTIELEGSKEGKGATFAITVPKGKKSQ